MPPKLSTQNDGAQPSQNSICHTCGIKVVDPVSCSECHHKSCTEKKPTPIPEVGFSKCCGSNSRPSSPDNTDSILQALSQDIKLLSLTKDEGHKKLNRSDSILQKNFLTRVQRQSTERVQNIHSQLYHLFQSQANQNSEYLLQEFEMR